MMSTSKIHIAVTSIPADTPDSATLALGTNVLGWELTAPGSAFVRGAGGVHRLALEVPKGTVLQYKITRGSWASVEKAADGSELPNRTHRVTGNATLHVQVARWADLGSPGAGHTIAGTVETLHEVESPQLGDRHDVFVYLPPSHASGSKRYPVLYMHDGQNVFDEATSFSGEWGADEAAEALAQRGKEVIIAAIANDARRLQEYAPFPSPHNDGTAHGARYAEFIARTVKPLMDARYRTLADPPHTGILGSSMGGLISLYTALSYPDLFGFAGAMSPSFWFADGAIHGWVLAHPVPGMRIYLDIGTAEAESPTSAERHVLDTLRMGDVLRGQGHTVRIEVAQGADHSEGAWRARFPKALRWFLASE